MSNIPPVIPNPYQATQATVQPTSSEGDGTGGLIPYKNPNALFAYYLGLFSLIPCIGLILGIAAVILGILGLRARSRNPAIKGSVHAWIGIVMGTIMSIIWGLMILAIIVVPMLGAMAK